MEPLFLTDAIIFNISDVTAEVFLASLLILVVRNTEKYKGLPHLYAAIVFIMAGTSARILANSFMGALPGDYALKTGEYFLQSMPREMMWIMSFIYIMLGVAESVTHIVYMNEGGSRIGLRSRYAATGALIVIGSVLFLLTDSTRSFTLCNLAQFGYFWLHIRRNFSKGAKREFIYASILPICMFVLALFFEPVRLTGIGLSVMQMIICGQYHNHIEKELTENEAALAKSRVQLLGEQISPHYIYNSLQSIRGICDEENSRARDAIDAFSEYLRGNLESLTDEDLIPFAAELEHTRAYLKLEQIVGNYSFDVEYRLDVTDFMLPPLVLQPLVENAVKHGASVGKAAITISTRESDGNIYIEVDDDIEVAGHPEAKAAACNSPSGQSQDIDSASAPKTAKNPPAYKRKSVGLDNVRTRLALQCGGTLDVTSSAMGTTATIKLPKIAM